MNKTQRVKYHTQLWPEAAAEQGWARADEAQRRAATRECMRLVHGPDTDSTTKLLEAEITALFLYLRHLANPGNESIRADWNRCCADYVKWNTLRQGNYWQRKTGYQRGGKFEQQRFGGVPATAMTRKEADQYLMTMRARVTRKAKATGTEDKIYKDAFL